MDASFSSNEKIHALAALNLKDNGSAGIIYNSI